MVDPFRTLAKDGPRRAEVRAICAEALVDYSGASWGEWETLAAVAFECAAGAPCGVCGGLYCECGCEVRARRAMHHFGGSPVPSSSVDQEGKR